MKAFKLTNGPFKGYTVETAPQDELAPVPEEAVQRVLDALGHPEAFVTDESTVSDFVSNRQCRRVSATLGISVTVHDRIVDLALRLHPH
jgi:hypothetical protein